MYVYKVYLSIQVLFKGAYVIRFRDHDMQTWFRRVGQLYILSHVNGYIDVTLAKINS